MKNSVKKMATFAIFGCVFLSGVFYAFEAKAYETDHKIKATICCLNCHYTGDSNDCISGDGTCVDHHCSSSETEETSGCTF